MEPNQNRLFDSVLASVGFVSTSQRIIADGDPEGTNDLQSLPAASDQAFSHGNVVAIHQTLVKRAFDDNWLKAGVNDELRDDRVAA